MKSILFILCAGSGLFAADSKPAVAAPDVILFNASIYQGGPDSSGPRPQALAIRDGRIAQIGMSADIRKLAGPKTNLVDLHGAFLMPGFNDAHIHLWSGGLEMQHVDLVSATSLDDMKTRIAAKAKETSPGAWMQGRGWDHTKWQNQILPTRRDIDAVTGDHPAF